jgi:uncharacterized RDD family membrane protein YckC
LIELSGSTLLPASLHRRLVALIYELLILLAILFIGALPAVMLTAHWIHPLARYFLQLWLLLVCGFCYSIQWVHYGQTLPMKTWKMHLVRRDGKTLTYRDAIQRYLSAVVGTLFFGIGFLWAIFDSERLFLHDRIAGTAIVLNQNR